MTLQKKLQQEGAFLFRYRSYLPLVFIIVFIFSLLSFGQELFDTQTQTYNYFLMFIAIVIGLLGQFIRIMVAGFVPKNTSGRNTKEQKADTLNTTGMYSLCRNPLYLGNFLMMLAPVILVGNWLLIFSFCLLFWLYYERIIYAEEAFLTEKFGESYLQWTEKTPAFFPNFKNYTKPELSFSLSATIRREYTSFLGLLFSIFSIHYIVMTYATKDFFIAFDHIVTYCLLGYLFVYIILRIFVKKTKIFHDRH